MSIFNLPNNTLIYNGNGQNHDGNKGLPTGTISLADFCERNCFYADKTRIIEVIEHSPACNHVIHRPLGTGKTLFLSMLRCFYDVSYSLVYEKIFKDQYIYSKDLKTHNTFCILDFNFNVTTNEEFREEIINGINLFCAKYHIRMNIDPTQSIKSILGNFFNSYVHEERHEPIFILVDNYDSFNSLNPVRTVINQEIDITFYQDFYKAIEKAEQNDIVARTYMAGVMPLYNIFSSLDITFEALDVSFDKVYAGAIGFTENDVKNLVRNAISIQQESNLSWDDLTENICSHLDGNTFTIGDSGRIINARLCIKFLTYLKSPVQATLITSNHTLYKCLQNLVNEYPEEIFEIEKSLSSMGNFTIYQTFDLLSEKKLERVCTILYYCGILTIKDTIQTDINIKTMSFRLANTYTADLWKKVVWSAYAKYDQHNA